MILPWKITHGVAPMDDGDLDGLSIDLLHRSLDGFFLAAGLDELFFLLLSNGCFDGLSCELDAVRIACCTCWMCRTASL